MAVDNTCNGTRIPCVRVSLTAVLILNVIERAPSTHEAPRSSPFLPQELLDLIIDHIDTADLKTLQACSLSGRCLRSRAQRAMFIDISFHLGNLTTMNECFRAAPTFTEAARHLGINAIEIVSDHDMSVLQSNIALLASGGQAGLRLCDMAPSLRSSSLTSIHMSMLSVPSFPDLVHMVCAFPCLSDLSCIRVRWGSEDSARLAIGNFQGRESAPSLKKISLRIGRTSKLLEVLFPVGREVVLRSIELDHFDTTSLGWPTLIRRAGLHLQELTMRPFYGGMLCNIVYDPVADQNILHPQNSLRWTCKAALVCELSGSTERRYSTRRPLQKPS